MLTWEDIIEAEDTSRRREYGRLCSGITLLRQGRAMIVMLPNDGFRVLSSGFTNGGFMESPLAVVNITGMGGKPEYTCMEEGLDTHDRVNYRYAEKLGLDADRTVFQGTAASMDNAAVSEMTSADGIKVAYVVTAGIRHNGGRAGDPTTYDESESSYDERPGTIITILAIDADLSDGDMFKVMLMATEAKSCVIQELQAKSLYSKGIATGSGTDQVAVIVNKKSPNKITGLTKDSELAKTLAQCMKDALRKAFDRQTGMNPQSQWDPLLLMSRRGLVPLEIREEMRFPATYAELMAALGQLSGDRYNTAVITALLNIADDIDNGLVDEKTGVDLAREICEELVLDEQDDPVVRLRLDDADNMHDLLSFVSALKVMDTVKERRVPDGQ
ncbi:MAG: adenosylcobinamide amidohydrolase [Candidatus Methanomethylophilaceae archaeon]|nr:adenosylcobinamide amidohydrolase [Candidatus Methanomethylophilaceae archaeon]MBQ9690011.1 adenosylcobinamide amidohydrolase [Candidatus Methanomethylophilaceae archaeon]